MSGTSTSQRAQRGTRPGRDEFDGPNKDEQWWHSDDSGSEGGSDEGGAAKEEDGLFDPDADERDAIWTDAQRQGRVSDAHLSCPGCFSTLSVDCQQHATYRSQYRAVFVTNVVVDVARTLAPAAGARGAPPPRPRPAPAPTDGGSGSGVAGGDGGSDGGPQPAPAHTTTGGSGGGGDSAPPEKKEGDEVFHPVACATCGTEVGVVDGDGVHHFFNVFPSNA